MNQFSSDYIKSKHICLPFSLLFVNVDDIGCPITMHVTLCKHMEKGIYPLNVTIRIPKCSILAKKEEETSKDLR